MRIRDGLNESLLRDPGQSKDFFYWKEVREIGSLKRT